MEHSGNKNQYKIPLLMALVSALSMIIGMRFQESLVVDGLVSPIQQDYSNSILEVSNHIKSKYYGPLNDTSFTDEVISNMVDQLDPYSHYFEEERSARYANYMEGLFTGIGIDFVIHEDSVFIYRVLPESPAESAGIKKGQVLLSIDSLRTDQGDDFRAILNGIQMNHGTRIKVETYDPKSEISIDTFLTVASIEVPLVRHYILTDDETGDECYYFQIDRFYKSIFVHFMDLIDQLSSNGGMIDRMIVDLRDNPGGVVEETTKLLNQLVNEEGKLLLSTNSKAGRVKEYLSNGRSFLNVGRIVILQNERSASASEIFSGTLQDHDRAVIMGKDSYGKGFIQQNIRLSNEGSLNLSVGEYILPGGRTIRRDTFFSDSIFYSLVNKRILRNGRGVPVDLQLQDCSAHVNADSLAKEIVVQSRGFDKLFSQSRIQELIPQEIRASLGEACEIDLAKRLSWTIAINRLHSGSTVQAEYGDAWIQEAYKLLSSERYDSILGNGD